MASQGLQYALDLIDKGFGVGIRKAKAQTKGLDDAVNRTDRNIAKIQVTGQNSFGGLSKIAKRAGGILAGVFAIGKLIAFGNEVTSVTARFEGFQNAIEFASGEDGAKNIEFLDNMIKDLNLDMGASYKGFQTLSGAVKGTSIAGQGLRDIFEGVATAATVMNLSSEQSEGAFLALSQMASKGKVQAEELRGQLGERIPGAFKIAADAMGVTQIKLNEMLDQGKLYSEDFLPKFAKQLKLTFQDGLGKAANSMQTAINKKNNALLSFKKNAGTAFRPLITGVLEAGSKLFGFLGELLTHLDPIRKAFNGVAVALEPLRDALMQANSPFLQFNESGLTAKSIMEGIGQVIEKLTPLIAFIAEIFGFMQTQVFKVHAVLKELVGGLFESGVAGEWLTNVLDNLKFIWELLSPVIGFVYDILAEGIKVIFLVIGAVMAISNAMASWGKDIEWVQRLLNAFVGAVKGVFGNIRDIVVNTLGSIGDLIVGVFTFDADKIASGLKKALDAQAGVAKHTFAGMKGAVDGWNKNLEAPIKKQIEVEVATGKKKAPQSMLDFLSGMDDGGKTKTDNKLTADLNGGSGSVAGGGGRTEKHTTFNIQSFVKELTIQTTNLKENPGDVKRMLTQIFQEMIGDLELRANA